MLRTSGKLLVRLGLIVMLLLVPWGRLCALNAKSDSPQPGEPTDPKARKIYRQANEWLKIGNHDDAINDFRKAAKLDGRCTDCFSQAFRLSYQLGRYKEAEQIARDWLPIAASDDERAAVHYRIALALQQEGISSNNEKCIDESCAEFKSALQLEPKLTTTHYALGISLAQLHQDDAARAEFSTFLETDTATPDAHDRARRFLDRVDLVRARMAPSFFITSINGQRVSLDSLAGKVVLIDFWATWCGPCLEALPNIRYLVNRFRDQPFVVISISLDKDENKWKEFVTKNKMTWLQYRDGGFESPIAKGFKVQAIPANFTIDADGVLEDQHVGDADIEGKLKKLIAAANENAHRKSTPPALEQRPAETSNAEKSPVGTN